MDGLCLRPHGCGPNIGVHSSPGPGEPRGWWGWCLSTQCGQDHHQQASAKGSAQASYLSPSHRACWPWAPVKAANQICSTEPSMIKPALWRGHWQDRTSLQPVGRWCRNMLNLIIKLKGRALSDTGHLQRQLLDSPRNTSLRVGGSTTASPSVSSSDLPGAATAGPRGPAPSVMRCHFLVLRITCHTH